MTPQERRARLDYILADLRAEVAKAETDRRPLEEMYSRVTGRISQLKAQLHQLETATNYFSKGHDETTAPLSAAEEADLDTALNRG